MIALKHIRDQYYTHIDIVEAAPFNVGHAGKYKGVGAHLFAIACKLSWDEGMKDMFNLQQNRFDRTLIKNAECKVY